MSIGLGEISNFLLITTAVVAWLTYWKYKETPLKYLPFYLTFAVFLELGADLLLSLDFYNTWWYNIGINIEILFYAYVFHQYIENKGTKRIVFWSVILYEMYFTINYLHDFLNMPNTYNTFQAAPFIAGGILVIVVVFLFLLEMFQSDKVLHAGRYLVFWVSLGLLFYNIIPIPSLALRELIPDGVKGSYIMPIQFTSNIIMYLLFIFGFIWSSMKYKS